MQDQATTNPQGASFIDPAPTSHSSGGPTKVHFVPIIAITCAIAIIFGLAGYYFGRQQPDTEKYTATSSPTPTTMEVSPAESIYSYGTFSFSYPKTWQVYDSANSKYFFSQYNLTGFDHLVALQNKDQYLMIGIDTEASDSAEAGGIFASDSEYSDFLANHDEVTIAGKKFYLWKGSSQLNTLKDSGREAGILALASLSEYISEKVTNEQNKSFDGYDNYIKNKNGSSYVFIKLSQDGDELTPVTIQAELKKVLESIRW